MSITRPGSITAANLTAQTNMFNQLSTLSQELGTGAASQTYAGLGSQAGLALSLGSQLSALGGYSSTATTVGTTLTLAQSVLTQLGDAGSSAQQSVNQQNAFALNNNGQTATQQSAASYLDQILSLLNTEVGDNYMFSGSALNQPSVASTSDILNGNGAQAGLTQVISERLQADEGTGNLGRLTIGGTAPNVTLSSDSSPFGFKLASVNSNLTGATVSGSPPSISVNLGSNPNSGDTISFGLTLPDGSSQTITLQATTASPPGANQFTIGASANATATNLQSALTTSVSNLAQTALPAASAIAAANNFFSSDPPQRVNPGSPADFATATSLQNGTTANTVFWYTGENGSTPAL
jgi:flagellar hook-associated protein 3 FlgL